MPIYASIIFRLTYYAYHCGVEIADLSPGTVFTRAIVETFVSTEMDETPECDNYVGHHDEELERVCEALCPRPFENEFGNMFSDRAPYYDQWCTGVWCRAIDVEIVEDLWESAGKAIEGTTSGISPAEGYSVRAMISLAMNGLRTSEITALRRRDCTVRRTGSVRVSPRTGQRVTVWNPVYSEFLATYLDTLDDDDLVVTPGRRPGTPGDMARLWATFRQIPGDLPWMAIPAMRSLYAATMIMKCRLETDESTVASLGVYEMGGLPGVIDDVVDRDE